MKRLKTLFEQTPSYIKWSDVKVAEKTGLTVRTVSNYRKSIDYQDIKKNYYNTCLAKKVSSVN